MKKEARKLTDAEQKKKRREEKDRLSGVLLSKAP